MNPLPALYGNVAKLVYGIERQLECDSYQLTVTAPTVEITNISIYGGLTGWPSGGARLTPFIPVMDDLVGSQRRYMEFGTPQQLAFGGIRRGKVSLTGICTFQSSTPHVGNYVRILLTHAVALGYTGVITVPSIVTEFTINQNVNGYMRWTCLADSQGDFDLTQV